MNARQMSIVAHANVEQRVVDEARAARKLGHGIARCGNSLECWRCGESGTVHPSTTVHGATVFRGTLADSKGCK